MATLTVEGKQYDMNELSDSAKAMANSVAFCDSKINQLEAELAMVKMARNGFVSQLVNELPQQKDEQPKKTTRKRTTATKASPAKKSTTTRKTATNSTEPKKAPTRKRAPAKPKATEAVSE